MVPIEEICINMKKNMPRLQNAFYIIVLHLCCTYQSAFIKYVLKTEIELDFRTHNRNIYLDLHPVYDSNCIIFIRLIIIVCEQFEHNMPFQNKLVNRVHGDVMFSSITSM